MLLIGVLEAPFPVIPEASAHDLRPKAIEVADGGATVQRGTTHFPSPTGEFSGLSTHDLIDRVHAVESQLKDFQKKYEDDFLGPNNAYPSDEKALSISEKYNGLYKSNLSKLCVSLVSEILDRLELVDGSSMTADERAGAAVIYRGTLAGPESVADAATFLDVLANRLATRGRAAQSRPGR